MKISTERTKSQDSFSIESTEEEVRNLVQRLRQYLKTADHRALHVLFMDMY